MSIFEDIKDEKLHYTVDELNMLMSLLLSEVITDGGIDEEVALNFKAIFNTFLTMCVKDRKNCDIMLELVHKHDANVDEVTEQAGNIIKGVLS